MNARLAASDVTFQYPGHKVLDGITFTANGGEFIVLLGINGAGKSTLLDLLAGLRSPGNGEVSLEGRNLTMWSANDRARRISHLPQGTRGELPFTVEQVVLMGRYAFADRWFESGEDHNYANDAMRRMDCFQFRDRLFRTLSAGEQQRVLLAACIAQCPAVMLFDEPSTFLDVHQQLQCFSTLAELAREGALVVAVTHDLNLALAHASRIIVLAGGAIAADFAIEEARAHPDWLARLSPRLEMVATAAGRLWVTYR
jgi:iron complex transport system ATP-binding protein